MERLPIRFEEEVLSKICIEWEEMGFAGPSGCNDISGYYRWTFSPDIKFKVRVKVNPEEIASVALISFINNKMEPILEKSYDDYVLDDNGSIYRDKDFCDCIFKVIGDTYENPGLRKEGK